MSERLTWTAVIVANGRREGVYSVLATDADDARAQIERELSEKPHRAALLQDWISQGRMVRVMRQRANKGAGHLAQRLI